MRAIYDDNSILINLNELVEVRAKLLTQYEDYSHAIATGEYLDENDVDRIAVNLRDTLTWDALFFMVDGAILDYMGLKNPKILLLALRRLYIMHFSAEYKEKNVS